MRIRYGKSVTIKDVARECNVSPMTVSWVMNKPERVHHLTRERVIAAIERLNYSPSAVARGLVRQRMNTLGVVRVGSVRVMSDPYFGHKLEGVLTRSHDKEQKTLLYIEDDWSKASEAISRFSDRQADGLLLIVPVDADSVFEVLECRGVPFVIIGDSRPEANLTTVDVDNVETGRIATQCLLDAGHRRIAHISGPYRHVSAGLRLEGYKLALRAAGIEMNPLLVAEGDYTIESGYSCASQLLEVARSERPSAIFCADDPMAFGAMDYLSEMGFKVPEDISLIGVNGGQDARDRGLTTLRQPFEAIGELATDLMLEMIETGESFGRKELLPPYIIQGRSIGPPKVC